MFTYSEHVLKICIAQLAKYVGFKSINELAFETLIDLLSRYILDFGKLSVSLANQCNRTQVNFDDLPFILKALGLNLDDLIDYFEHVKLPFSGPLLPNYPVNSKQTFRCHFPSKSECERRKEFYQDWQPTIDLDQHQYLNRLDPQERNRIENRLEQLDLIDYLEQHRKLKISEDSNVNRKILNRIRSKVNELNIGGFTDLEAQVPNYIYLSSDGQALSFGNKQAGKLPEARQHPTSSTSNSKSKRSHLKRSSKRSSANKSSKSDKKKKSKHPSIDYIEKVNQTNLNRQLGDKQSIYFESERNKSEEQLVSDLMNEMISAVEDKKFNESFYDENEAAKTLVLLSYDSSKSFLSAAESPSIDESENQIDYSLTKFNYDLNNNHSGIADLNNNTIEPRKQNGYSFNNLINGKLDKSVTNDYHSRLNDVKNLTIEDEGTCKKNGTILPKKLTLKLTFDKYKESLSHHSDSSDHQTDSSHVQQQKTKDKSHKRKDKKLNMNKYEEDTPVSTFNHLKSTKKNMNNITYYCPTCSEKDDGTPMICCDQCEDWFHWRCQNIYVAPKEDKWYCLNCSVQQSLADSKKSKKSSKKKLKEEIISLDKQSKKRSKHVQKQEDKKSQKNQSNSSKEIYFCPSCSKPDTGIPMIGCDKCDSWFHYKCVGLAATPPEDESWFCPDCKRKKKLKKLKK